jgi:DNA-directed RNA polymerase subunit RPC12/RpoP
MKVINSEPDKSVVKTIICMHCGVTIEYVPNDIKVLWRATEIDGGIEVGMGFECPNCNKRIVTKRI